MCKANQRAVSETVEMLELMGHTLVEFKIDNFEDMTLNYFSLMSLAGLKRINDGRENEDLVDGIF